MGAITFEPGQLCDHLHEVVGYKAGVAISIDGLSKLLAGTTHADAPADSEQHGYRLRAEVYEDLYFTLLHKVGHTAVKHEGYGDVLRLHDRLRAEHGREFVEQLQEIYMAEVRAAMDVAVKDGSRVMDPTSVLRAAFDARGKAGLLAMGEMLETSENVWRLSPHNRSRWIEWTDVVSLDGIFTRATSPTQHGTFFDQRLIDFLSANTELIHKMHWRKFEELVAEKFHREGYKVELGTGQNDDGIDIRIWSPSEDSGGAGRLHLVQCKRQKTKVEKVVVKGLYADVEFQNAALGVLVTTASLSKGARQTISVRGYPIAEVDGRQVTQWLEALRTPGTGIVR